MLMGLRDVDLKTISSELEASRLRALHELHILDTEPEEAFDDLVWLASRLCEVPIALTTLVDEKRQWFKSKIGLDCPSTDRDASLCAHAMAGTDLLIVKDTLVDPRFSANPLVTGEPYMRFYAGAPLIGSDGHPYGALCVIDAQPRELTIDQREGLSRLARRAVDSLESRRRRWLSEVRARTLDRLLEAMPDGVVTCTADGVLERFNLRARQWHGVDPRALPASEWPEHFGLFSSDGVTPLRPDEVPLSRALSGEIIRDVEMVIRSADESVRSVLCYAEPLYDSDGRAMGALCVMRDITDEKAAKIAALIESRRFYESFHSASQGMALVGLEGQWLEVNDAVCEIFGYTRTEMMALSFQVLTHPDDLDADLQLLNALVDGTRNSYQLNKRYLHKDGHTVHALLSVSAVRDADRSVLHFVSQVHDLTQQLLAESALRESERRLRRVADNVPALIARVGPDLRYEFVNRAYASWFGTSPEQMTGRHMSDVLLPEHYAYIDQYLREVLRGHEVSFDLDLASNEEIRHFHVSYLPTKEDLAEGQVCGFHITAHDVSVHVKHSRDLERKAYTDSLTGLPNRAAWDAWLQEAWRRPIKAGLTLWIAFLDINEFKSINDTYGHGVGDKVLQIVSYRIRSELRPLDYFARLAGDEFVIGFTAPLRLADEQMKSRVHRAIAEPVKAGRLSIPVSVSIGCAKRDPDDVDPDALISRADMDMYRHKLG